MTHRIPALIAVTFLSACGSGAHSGAAPSETPRTVGFQATAADVATASAAAPEDAGNTADDYVVGPIIEPTEDGHPGVPTYYIVRN